MLFLTQEERSRIITWVVRRAPQSKLRSLVQILFEGYPAKGGGSGGPLVMARIPESPSHVPLSKEKGE